MGWSDEPSENYEKWKSGLDGSIMCDCDHGCRQWIKNNWTKISLVLKYKDKPALLDKIVSMENARANNIWYWLEMREVKKFNEELRKK